MRIVFRPMQVYVIISASDLFARIQRDREGVSLCANRTTAICKLASEFAIILCDRRRYRREQSRTHTIRTRIYSLVVVCVLKVQAPDWRIFIAKAPDLSWYKNGSNLIFIGNARQEYLPNVLI